MSNSNDNSEEKKPEKKLLEKKRLPNYSLEDIINIYCCQHKIQDNEIMDKIKTIQYEKPSESIKINYDKDKGDRFPLSNHIKPVHLQKELELEEKQEEKVEDKKEEKEEEKKEDIPSCYLCGWVFFEGMLYEEKIKHIYACVEGKGEENKKELISTYALIGKLQNQDEGNNNDNINNINVKEENHENIRDEMNEKNKENKNEEDEDADDEKEEESINKNEKKKIINDNNDDLML